VEFGRNQPEKVEVQDSVWVAEKFFELGKNRKRNSESER